MSSVEEGGRRQVYTGIGYGTLSTDILDVAMQDQVHALAATVDARGPCTYGHSKRVVTISEIIGKAIGLSQKELADLRAASLLHDIGKVGVPDSIRCAGP